MTLSDSKKSKNVQKPLQGNQIAFLGKKEGLRNRTISEMLVNKNRVFGVGGWGEGSASNDPKKGSKKVAVVQKREGSWYIITAQLENGISKRNRVGGF